MIMGFLLIGITLGYWTVKSATSIPVHESNEYLMKYQQADMNINEILKRKAAFDRDYSIGIVGAKMAFNTIENSKVAKKEKSVILTAGKNSFQYRIAKKDGTVVPDAQVTFLLTRPHTDKEDVLLEHIPFKNGTYLAEDVNVSNPGRYILRLRVDIDKNSVGYLEIPAYLKP